MISHKVITTKNKKKPKESAYNQVDSIMILEYEGFKFSLHRSYNSLISCYMLSEYKTGCVFTAFGIPKLDMKDADVDRTVQRAKDYLSKHTHSSISEQIAKLPEVNNDEPDVDQEPSYIDVEIARKNAKIKEETIKRKFEKKESPVQRTKKKARKSTATKKKRGRPKKKPNKVNTLI